MMKILYRYDDTGLYIGTIEQQINSSYNLPDDIIDHGYYDENGNPPIPPEVGRDEKAIWIGYRYSIEPKYLIFTNTTEISPGDNPEGKVFDGDKWI